MLVFYQCVLQAAVYFRFQGLQLWDINGFFYPLVACKIPFVFVYVFVLFLFFVLIVIFLRVCFCWGLGIIKLGRESGREEDLERIGEGKTTSSKHMIWKNNYKRRTNLLKYHTSKSVKVITTVIKYEDSFTCLHF